MKASTTLTYWKVYNKYLYRYQLERENSDREIEAATIASEVEEQIEEMMRRDVLSGKITITIAIGEE